MSVLSKFKDKSLPVEVKASAAYTVCSVIQKSLSFITLPLFSRLLTTEQYGQSTVYQSWFSILVIFITLQLPYGSFNTAMLKFKDDRDGYISSVNGLCTVLCLIFLCIYFPFYKRWNALFELPTSMVLFMITEILMNNAIQLWYGKERFEYKSRQVIALTLVTSVLSPILSFVLVMHTNEKGYARILGNVLIIIASGLTCYIYSQIKGKKFFNKEFWRYALSFNIPLIPYYLSQSVFNQRDRIMISHIKTTGEAAIYGVGYSLAMVLNFVLNSINNAYVPWFYQKVENGEGKKNQSVSLMIAILMAVLLLGVILVAPEIILIMAGRKYLGAVNVVPPVAMSLLLLFYAQMFIDVEFYYEKKKYLVIATVSAAVLNIVLNSIFIPSFGYVAAAYTTLASYVLFAVGNYFAYKMTVKAVGTEDNMFNLKLLIMLYLSFTFIGFLEMALYKFFIIRYVVVAVVAFVLFIKRKSIIEKTKPYIQLFR